ncbi:MAG TPA: DUF481 domain-containing protein [Gemmatimonadaceae bacterium]
MAHFARLGLIALAVIVTPVTSFAQLASGWTASGSLNATVLFGGTAQRIVATSTEIARADSALEASVGINYKYGEAAAEDGNNFVSARSWSVSVSADPAPFARLTPFAFGSVESSLQRQISRRYSGGSGAKWTFARTERGNASVSVAALGERTIARRIDLNAPVEPPTVLGRWSLRMKAKRRVQERLTLEHLTLYQPTFTNTNHYTVTTSSEAEYRIFETVGVNLSLADSYDSDARERGARSNHDGQFLVGLKVSF